MTNNTQSRKWALVINNPQECGLNHEVLIEILQKFAPKYFCMADEIATTGTPHAHIFLYSLSPIRFGTIKNRFPIAHIEKALGSARENRDYIRKEGKWADTDKAETSVEGSFYEWGELPTERQEVSPKMSQLIDDIRDGLTNTEILDKSPDLGFRVRDIDVLRQTLLAEKYIAENRPVEVWYVCGPSGVGKTRGIFERHHAKDICRITNYRQGKGISFDNYHGQDVLVFEEFYGQVPIAEMLNFLDIYPLSLPARYADRVACYTTVYITSNIPLEEQYRELQAAYPETWKALLRRINHLLIYSEDGNVEEIELSERVELE